MSQMTDKTKEKIILHAFSHSKSLLRHRWYQKLVTMKQLIKYKWAAVHQWSSIWCLRYTGRGSVLLICFPSYFSALTWMIIVYGLQSWFYLKVVLNPRGPTTTNLSFLVFPLSCLESNKSPIFFATSLAWFIAMFIIAMLSCKTNSLVV